MLIKKLFKGFMMFSGLLFWGISLSLILPVSGVMGWVSLLGIYWMVFGIPLALMLVVVALLSLLLVKMYYNFRVVKQ